WQRGDESAKVYNINQADQYDKLLIQRTSGLARKSASSIVNNSINTDGEKRLYELATMYLKLLFIIDSQEGIDDAVDDNDVLLPDATEHEFWFSAILDGTDIASGFQQLFSLVKKKKVYIKDTDEALARSGVILLEKEETELQKPAIEEFPESDSSKEHSEFSAISSFILPLCRVFMSMSYKRCRLNERIGRSSRSRMESYLALEIKDKTNKSICEVGIGEVTSHEQKGHHKNNAKDLVRIGLSLKDDLDWMDNYDEDAVLVMEHISICGADQDWNDLKTTVEQGLDPLLKAVESGRKKLVGTIDPLSSAHSRISTTRPRISTTPPRISTTRTPKFKTFLG
ncbi:hypothetical protein BGZ65_009083, partial [Modicella reniformis]